MIHCKVYIFNHSSTNLYLKIILIKNLNLNRPSCWSGHLKMVWRMRNRQKMHPRSHFLKLNFLGKHLSIHNLIHANYSFNLQIWHVFIKHFFNSARWRIFKQHGIHLFLLIQLGSVKGCRSVNDKHLSFNSNLLLERTYRATDSSSLAPF